MLLDQIEHLKALGVTLLACKEGIDDDVHSASRMLAFRPIDALHAPILTCWHEARAQR